MSSFWPMPGQGLDEKEKKAPNTSRSPSKAAQALLAKGPGHVQRTDLESAASLQNALANAINAGVPSLTLYNKRGGGLHGAFEAVARVWPVSDSLLNQQMEHIPFTRIKDLVALYQLGANGNRVPKIICSLNTRRKPTESRSFISPYTQDELKEYGKVIGILAPVSWTPPQV